MSYLWRFTRNLYFKPDRSVSINFELQLPRHTCPLTLNGINFQEGHVLAQSCRGDSDLPGTCCLGAITVGHSF